MDSIPMLDCAGRHRSPATLASFHRGLPPRNKGLRYPPDPPTVEEIVAVMRAAGDSTEGTWIVRSCRTTSATRSSRALLASCQWPSSSPQRRPRISPLVAISFSPLVATNLPTNRSTWFRCVR
jgi:hypothetical protein